jgi:hypothetical protein
MPLGLSLACSALKPFVDPFRSDSEVGYPLRMSSDKAVLFVDVLGFSRLVEQHDAEIDALDPSFPGNAMLDEFADRIGRTTGVLEERFRRFHRSLESNMLTTLRHHHVTSLVFSDSAFLVHDEPNVTLWSALELMRTLLLERIPVRMGIGIGSFRALRFASDNSARGVMQSSQFLGTGIVRAHRAEHCGLPGMRILIDSSAESSARAYAGPPTLAVTPDSRYPKAVSLEGNYLFPSKKVIDTSTVLGMMAANSKRTNAHLVGAVTALRSEAPPELQYHHDATLSAMERMRQALEIPEGEMETA